MAPRHNFDKQTAEFRIRIQETRSPREIMQENPESRIWTGLWGFCVDERGIQNSEFDGPRQGAEYFIIDNSRIRPDSQILHHSARAGGLQPWIMARKTTSLIPLLERSHARDVPS